MWLIRTDTLELEEFYTNIPKYGILSHRWEDKQEVSFQALVTAPTHLRGYQKIINFCAKARADGFEYGWVDTYCIDKKNSAELSEAINSMFMWYREAATCYVYLNDVIDGRDFGQSAWFTRGWTLQELLASGKVMFFDQDWQLIGDKCGCALPLSHVTGIPEGALLDFKREKCSVAERMLWCASRTTTREEASPIIC